MAHKKAAGVTKNGRDSNPKYLGVKLSDGQSAFPGSIIIRQRGTSFIAGKNTKMGRDHTIYSLVDGKVKINNKRKTHFDGSNVYRKIVNVL